MSNRPSNRATQARNEAILARLEVPFAQGVKNARNAFVEGCAAAYETQGLAGIDGELLVHRVALRQLLEAHARLVIPRFAAITRRGIEALSVKSEDPNRFLSLIEAWLAEQGLQRAASIADTALQDVMRAITRGVDQGEGTEAIARRIRTVAKLSPWRAATIARTETHQAALFAQAETARTSAEEYGLKLEKVWLATLDSRTRDAHAAMNGKAVPIDQKFNVGGVLMDRPGDPAGGAANVVNCRCTLIHREVQE
jgi:SPP1 gp7 family putative phage head morphogenesis protein